MCRYQNGTWECRHDGYMWDADSAGYDPQDLSYPCPECNTEVYLRNAQEEAESVSEGSSNGYNYTGESLWLNAVAVAEEANLEAAKEALKKIGLVEALVPAENAEQYEVVRYLYN